MRRRDVLAAVGGALGAALSGSMRVTAAGAETMTGRDGITAHAIDHDRLRQIMRDHGRLTD